MPVTTSQNEIAEDAEITYLLVGWKATDVTAPVVLFHVDSGVPFRPFHSVMVESICEAAKYFPSGLKMMAFAGNLLSEFVLAIPGVFASKTVTPPSEPAATMIFPSGEKERAVISLLIAGNFPVCTPLV